VIRREPFPALPPGRVQFQARCRPWRAEGVGLHLVAIETDGSVLVWDHVANAYTRCHSLGRSALARFRRRARLVRAHEAARLLHPRWIPTEL